MDIPQIFNITERAHRIYNPFTPEKLATLGAPLRLETVARVLDLSSGSGEMLMPHAAHVLLLLTRRFEMWVGSETDGAVNWTTAVYERVREFGPLLSAGDAERVRSGPRRGMAV